MVKEFLSQRAVPFTVRNVTHDPQALREFQARGYLLPPVTVVDGQAVAGYDPARLEALLFPELFS